MLGLAIAIKNGQQLVATMRGNFVSEAEDGGSREKWGCANCGAGSGLGGLSAASHSSHPLPSTIAYLMLNLLIGGQCLLWIFEKLDILERSSRRIFWDPVKVVEYMSRWFLAQSGISSSSCSNQSQPTTMWYAINPKQLLSGILPF